MCDCHTVTTCLISLFPTTELLRMRLSDYAVEGVVPYSSVDIVPNVFVVLLSASVYCELGETV